MFTEALDNNQTIVGQKSSLRNVLRLNVPGLTKDLQVRFPDCRLPVCGRCKKNYKTRDMCRSQGEHTDLPWSSVYICVTLDHSCTNANNRLHSGKNVTYTARNMDWMPYCFKSDVSPKTLICAACKTKNYTRKQCRGKSKHRFLPWSTVYVTLSCDTGGRSSDDQDPPGAKRSRSNKADDSESEGCSAQNKRRALGDSKEEKRYESLPFKKDNDSIGKPDGSTKPGTGDEYYPEVDEEKSDDITIVDKSRTFLIQVSVDSCVVKWLDYDRNKTIPGHPVSHDVMGSAVYSAAAYHCGLVAHQAQMYGRNARLSYPNPGADAALMTMNNPQMFQDVAPRSQFPPNYMHPAYGGVWGAMMNGGMYGQSNQNTGKDNGDGIVDYSSSNHQVVHPYWNYVEQYAGGDDIGRGGPCFGYQGNTYDSMNRSPLAYNFPGAHTEQPLANQMQDAEYNNDHRHNDNSVRI